MSPLLILGILFSTAVRTVVVAVLVILGILPLSSFILALSAAVIAELVILGILPLTSLYNIIFKLLISAILSSIFFILVLYTSFLTPSFFTTSLSLLKLTGTCSNLSTSNYSTFKIA